MSKKRAISSQNPSSEGQEETHSGEQYADIKKKYDPNYLKKCIDRATPHWKDIDSENWLREIRGDYE